MFDRGQKGKEREEIRLRFYMKFQALDVMDGNVNLSIGDVSKIDNWPNGQRWRLGHLPIILRIWFPKNPHKNAQKSSKIFKPSIHNVVNTGTTFAKNMALVVLGSQGIVVKCTAAMFFRTVDL